MWRRACSRRSPRPSSARRAARLLAAGPALGAAVAAVRGGAQRGDGRGRWPVADRHADRRTRRRRGARARAPARVSALASPARGAPARERGARARARTRADRAPRGRRPDDHSVDPRACSRHCARRARARGRQHSRGRDRRARCCWTAPVRASSGACVARRRAPGRAGRWCSPRAHGRRDRRARRSEERVPVRPVKGQIVRLRDPAGPGLLGRVAALRRRLSGARARTAATCSGRRSRRAASISTPTVGRRVRAAARRAASSCRASTSCRSRSCRVGLRPGTPDNAPADRAGRDLGHRRGRLGTIATACCSRRSPRELVADRSREQASPLPEACSPAALLLLRARRERVTAAAVGARS